jgi:hypothetical protein
MMEIWQKVIQKACKAMQRSCKTQGDGRQVAKCKTMGTICKLQGNGIKNCDEDIRKT